MEEWRIIPGYEGSYEVSSLGRVRSLERTIVNAGKAATRTRNGKTFPISSYERSRIVPARILKPTVMKNGYQRVMLGRGNPQYVHELVLIVFKGPRPADGWVCRHLDGDRTNNARENLAWGTAKENCGDTIEHGRSTRGRNHQLKLTEDLVRYIRQSPKSTYKLARELECSRWTIQDARNGKNWTWVE